VGYVSWLRQVDVSAALSAAKRAALRPPKDEDDDDTSQAYAPGAVKDYPEVRTTTILPSPLSFQKALMGVPLPLSLYSMIR
jgi:hypothetical protein